MDVQPTPAARKLVVLEDGMLTSLASTIRFVTAFPFLAQLQNVAAAPGGCGPCQQKAQARVDKFAVVKRAIGTASPEIKRKLREMLNAKFVRVSFHDNHGKAIQLTF